MKRLWAPWRMPYLLNEDEKPEGCIFCHKAERSDEEEHILYRGEHVFVALNRYPYSNGHMLVIPYRHTSRLEALDDSTLLEMMQITRCTLRILRAVYQPQGFNVGINEGEAAGAGVAEHLHLHIVPRWNHDANYMTVIGETRVLPEMLDETYRIFRPRFDRLEALSEEVD
ncbi:MAG: HIT family protein [Anaerolineae bacterium]